MRFDIHLPGEIRFGVARSRELGGIVARYGRPRVLCVTGRRALGESGALARILEDLRGAAGHVVHYSLPGGEPGAAEVDDGAMLARVESCRVVVAVGGGAALDAGKAIAALAPRSEPAETFIEGLGGGGEIREPGLPCIALPTTAGTGTEATRNSVLGSREKRYKRSIRSVHLVPRVAVVDPELTVTCPPGVTAASGMDAIVQLIEAYLSRNAQPFTDALAAQALPGAVEALRRCWGDPRDLGARTAMSRAALYSGIGLAHAGLGAVHGLATPIGAQTDVPHGVACARMIAASLRENLRACGDKDVLRRLGDVGRWLTGAGASRGDAADAEAGADRLGALADELRVPRFRDYGVTEAQAGEIAANPGGNLKTNPGALDPAALERIVRAGM